jgi:pilus assembly protein Flp/PilA
MTLWWHWLTAQTRARGWTSGQGLVEYALILIFVAVVLIALLTILGPGLKQIYQDIVDELNAI